jgi:hypothetical protein
MVGDYKMLDEKKGGARYNMVPFICISLCKKDEIEK